MMMIVSTICSIDSVTFEKTFLAHIDLKPHIPNGESLVIDGKSTRSVSNYDSRVSFSWSPEKKIEYNLYRTPGKTGTWKLRQYEIKTVRKKSVLWKTIQNFLSTVGFTLSLPQRQIAGEAIYNFKLDATNGQAKLAGTVWFDKIRNENDLAMFTVGTEYKVPETENGIAVRSTVGVRLPTLPKVSFPERILNIDRVLDSYSEKIMTSPTIPNPSGKLNKITVFRCDFTADESVKTHSNVSVCRVFIVHLAETSDLTPSFLSQTKSWIRH